MDVLWEREEAEYLYRGGDDRVDDEQPLRSECQRDTPHGYSREEVGTYSPAGQAEAAVQSRLNTGLQHA
jgi:hypothetical protein